MKINPRLLPIKAHYFFFMAGKNTHLFVKDYVLKDDVFRYTDNTSRY